MAKAITPAQWRRLFVMRKAILDGWYDEFAEAGNRTCRVDAATGGPPNAPGAEHRRDTRRWEIPQWTT